MEGTTGRGACDDLSGLQYKKLHSYVPVEDGYIGGYYKDGRDTDCGNW